MQFIRPPKYDNDEISNNCFIIFILNGNKHTHLNPKGQMLQVESGQPQLG